MQETRLSRDGRSKCFEGGSRPLANHRHSKYINEKPYHISDLAVLLTPSLGSKWVWKRQPLPISLIDAVKT